MTPPRIGRGARVGAALAFLLLVAAPSSTALEGRIAVAIKTGGLHVHAPDGATLARVPTGEGPRSVTPYGTRLFVAERGVGDAPGSTITVVDLATLQRERSARLCAGCAPRDVAFDMDGTMWFTGQAHKAVYWSGMPWGAPDGSVVAGLAWPSALAMTDDGARLAVGFRDGGEIVVIDTTAKTLRRLSVTKSPTFVAARPGAREFWVGSDIDGDLVRLRVGPDGVPAEPETVRSQSFTGGLAFLPDGSRVVVTDVARQTVSVLDAESGRRLAEMELETQPGLVAVSPAGDAVAVIAGDGGATIRILTIAPDGSLASAGAFEAAGPVTALAWVP